ncbi:2TM domain-containing protein [Flavobacterium urocaniciphilum]|uniref:2TM domain-containing protein n=1 Tax=Flavobacterium urocaniciphilum TaxID=1299341 RepID=A0A1H8YYB8_9FLAO|nr:2TM domain-containing protein [Flavobacterium urocaniciphilum]SEP57102.1 2TM domain-containing protein [Flavobacterium urocaniciphilum]
METQDKIKYEEALQKVRKIKAFYVHLIVFILVNIYVIIKKTNQIDEGETIWDAFKLAFFWGIGLVFHGLRTFDLIPFFGKDWEDRKVKELMDKEKNQDRKF